MIKNTLKTEVGTKPLLSSPPPRKKTARTNLSDFQAVQNLAEKAKQILFDAKAEDIRSYNFTSPLSYANFIIVCSANSETHLQSLGRRLYRILKTDCRERPIGSSKFLLDDKRWIVLDYVDVIIHIFLQEDRLYYKLDEKIERDRAKQQNITT